jgi:hypothetical protein
MDGCQNLGIEPSAPLIVGASCSVMFGPIKRGRSMLLRADQHNRLAEIYEEAAADQSHTPEDRAFLADKAARFRFCARIAEEKAKGRRLN